MKTINITQKENLKKDDNLMDKTNIFNNQTFYSDKRNLLKRAQSAGRFKIFDKNMFKIQNLLSHRNQEFNKTDL